MNQADALAELRTGLSRLTPDWQRPERFHEAKSELLALVRAIPQATASDDGTDRIARARTTAQGEQIREMQRQLRVLTKVVATLGRARTPRRRRDARQAEMIER